MTLPAPRSNERTLPACAWAPPWVACLAVVLAPGAESAAGARDCRVLEDFSSSTVGQFPVGWSPRRNSVRDSFRVHKEHGVRFLRATSEGHGLGADRVGGWDLERYPILAWSWRPRVFPSGADEREGPNDSALGVYVGFSWRSGSLKYVWSERLPLGTEFSVTFGRTKMRVVNAGRPADRETWVEVEVDLRGDYLRRFGRARIEPPAGLSILTDADDSLSRAVGDYANFRVCAR